MPRTKGAKNHPKFVIEGVIADWREGLSLYEISKKWGITNDSCAGGLITYRRKKDPTIPYRYDKGRA